MDSKKGLYNGALLSKSSGYDLYGNRLTDTHLHNPTDSETYSYDSAQRVDGYDRDNGFAQNWQLDDLGNWTQFDNNGSIESRTHNEMNEIVSITPQTSITHDTNGNMTWDGERSLEWDGLNRLIRVSGNVGTIAKCYYNAMNMRVQKHIDTDNDGLLDDKTNYIYCHQKVCVEQDENGNLKKDYVHGGQYIDQVIMESDSSTSLGSYYLTDLRYSVYAVVDSSGVIQERYRYDAYGKRDVMTPGFVVVNTDAETEFGYTGRRHDKEDTGLMYFRARYYSAELGRFVGRDPIGYVDGMSLYAGYFGMFLGLDPMGTTMTYNECVDFCRENTYNPCVEAGNQPPLECQSAFENCKKSCQNPPPNPGSLCDHTDPNNDYREYKLYRIVCSKTCGENYFEEEGDERQGWRCARKENFFTSWGEWEKTGEPYYHCPLGYSFERYFSN